MRLVKVPSREKDVAIWINADMVTQISIGPYFDDAKITEVTVNFSGDEYRDFLFRSKEEAAYLANIIADSEVVTHEDF